MTFLRRKNSVRILRNVALIVFVLLLSPLSAAGDELEKEIRLGEKAAKSIEEHWERVSDPVRTAHLNMLLSRFIPCMERPLPYEVRIVREKMINAFSLPGGIVYFTTGMLDFLRTDAEIAAILAHELVHADRRHAVIHTARASRISIAAVALMIATGGAAGPMLLTSLVQVAVTNSYSIDLEQEADKEGFRSLVEAGFPPSAMITVLEAMEYDQLRRPSVDMGVFMTHPEIKERIQYISETARQQKIPIRRKEALNQLLPTVVSDSKKIRLLIDDVEVWSMPLSAANERLLKEIAGKLQTFFQMETPPYEIQVLQKDGKKVLRVGPSVLASEPLPAETPSLDTFRTALVEALNRSKRKHPGMTSFL